MEEACNYDFFVINVSPTNEGVSTYTLIRETDVNGADLSVPPEDAFDPSSQASEHRADSCAPAYLARTDPALEGKRP